MTTKICIHVGLPKTGTTTLQRVLFDHAPALLRAGILYDPLVYSPADPKHQWLLQCLRDSDHLTEQDFTRFAGAHTVLLSTESITNEFPLLQQDHIDRVTASLRDLGELRLLLTWRDPLPWAKSYYKQAIINQPSALMSFYSTALPFDQFIADPHVALLMDRAALRQQMETAFQAPVTLVRYGSNVVTDAMQAMAPMPVSLRAPVNTGLNTSVDDVVAEVFRQLNASIATLHEKCAWAWALQKTVKTGSAVLHNLANRATAAHLTRLDPDLVRAIRYQPNAPLKYDAAQLDELTGRLLHTVLTRPGQ